MPSSLGFISVTILSLFSTIGPLVYTQMSLMCELAV